MGPMGWIVFVLIVIGGLNWGLIGFFNFDIVAAIFGTMSVASRVVYALVGLAALYKLIKVLAGKPNMSAPSATV